MIFYIHSHDGSRSRETGLGRGTRLIGKEVSVYAAQTEKEM